MFLSGQETDLNDFRESNAKRRESKPQSNAKGVIFAHLNTDMYGGEVICQVGGDTGELFSVMSITF